MITLAETLITGYHENRVQLLFYYTLVYGKYTNTIDVWNAIQGQTYQAATSLETIQLFKSLRETIQVLICMHLTAKTLLVSENHLHHL